MVGPLLTHEAAYRTNTVGTQAHPLMASTRANWRILARYTRLRAKPVGRWPLRLHKVLAINEPIL